MNKVLIAEARTERTKLGRDHVMHKVEVWIDRDRNRMGTCRPFLQPEPHDWSDMREDWIQKYQHCRVCGIEVDDDELAWAYWKMQTPVCSTDCIRVEQLKRFACCDQARQLQRNCVCMYATECPVHGERHHGTHE